MAFPYHSSPSARRIVGVRGSSARAGFTLIELLVVCAIMIIVTSIILANNNQYGGQVLLQNFAYDVALSVRQAQVYGISVERFGSGSGSTFAAGYGMHFDSSLPTQYNLFADLDGTGIYDTSKAEDVSPSPYAINRGYKISDLCYTPSGSGSETCYSSGGGTPKTIDILFERPEPDAYIAINGAQCYGAVAPQCESSARIVLQSPRGDTMSVSVEANGQIAVDQKVGISP